jgi:hypothetical protein
VSIDGKGDDWTMTLVPTDSRMKQKVSSITLAGTGAALARVEIRQADGDRSLMRLQDASAH